MEVPVYGEPHRKKVDSLHATPKPQCLKGLTQL